MMEFILDHILTLILFLPVLGSVVVLCLPNGKLSAIRWTALGTSLLPFILTIILWSHFMPGAEGYQFEEQYNWYPAINSSFHVGVDGLSLTMVLLTTLLTPIALLASFNITDRLKVYMFLFLLLETGMLPMTEPVTDLTAAEVTSGLDRLRELVLAWKVTGGRADKWEHNLDAKWQLGRPEKALVALLLLRGAQTAAELRTRAERMNDFASLEAASITNTSAIPE